MKSKWAVSLIELLVWMAMASVLMTLLVSMFVSIFRVYLFSQSRMDVRQAAIQYIRLLTREISNTVAEAMTISQAPTSTVPVAMSLVQIEDFSSTNNFRWHQGFELFYFDKATEKLMWRRIRPAGYDFTVGQPPCLSQADLVTQLTAKPLEQRVVAFHVHKLTIQTAMPLNNQIVLPLSISIDTRIEESTDAGTRTKAEMFHLETVVNPLSKRW